MHMIVLTKQKKNGVLMMSLMYGVHLEVELIICLEIDKFK